MIRSDRSYRHANQLRFQIETQIVRLKGRSVVRTVSESRLLITGNPRLATLPSSRPAAFQPNLGRNQRRAPCRRCVVR
jgi:hypothetical protein